MSRVPELFTREQLAELYGVHPLTIVTWTLRGMPIVRGGIPVGGARGRRQPFDWRVTRRELARLLDLHADTLTDALHRGLRAAVVVQGGHSKESIFDLRIAFRWFLADRGVLEWALADDARLRAKLLAIGATPDSVLAQIDGNWETDPAPRSDRAARRAAQKGPLHR